MGSLVGKIPDQQASELGFESQQLFVCWYFLYLIFISNGLQNNKWISHRLELWDFAQKWVRCYYGHAQVGKLHKSPPSSHFFSTKKKKKGSPFGNLIERNGRNEDEKLLLEIASNYYFSVVNYLDFIFVKGKLTWLLICVYLVWNKSSLVFKEVTLHFLCTHNKNWNSIYI